MATNLRSCRLVSDSGGASKAQAALGKILAVISTVPPSLISTTAAPLNSKSAFDLNLRSGVESEHGSLVTDPVAAKAAAPANSVGLSNYGSISPAESVAGDARTAERNSKGECDTEEKEEGGKMRNDDDDDSSEEAKEEISEITNNNNNKNNIVVQSESKGSSNGIESEYADNYLDLLLEAVDQHEQLRAVDDGEEIPTKEKSEGVNNNSSKERDGSSLKRSRVEMVNPLELYEEETAPVVRSKRGRNQKLPSRYRDSVLEPWAKPPTATARTRTRGPLPIGP